MPKKLDILIPQYKETDSVIKPLLDSIALQQNVDLKDIGVIITNDGTDIRLSKEFLESYPFDITYQLGEHKGVSGTRNSCLDASTADYVMFCDADDMFYNMCGLYLIFQEIAKGFDVFVSYFTEEGRDKNGNPFYTDHQMDATFVHGKVFRRQFLIDKKIRWDESLTIHEDSYFNYLSQACAAEGQLKLCKCPFYLWKWNGSSVSRNDKKYILKTYIKMLDSTSALIRQLISRGKPQKAREIATNITYDCYFLMNKDEWWEEENVEYWNATAARMKEYYREFWALVETIEPEKRKELIKNLKNKKFNEGLVMERMTYDHWIDYIKNFDNERPKSNS